MTDAPAPEETAKWQRCLAAQANNRAWTLAESAQRTAHEDEEMLSAAHAAWYLWRIVGDARNHAHADQLLAHVHALRGDAAGAAPYADRSFAFFTGSDGAPWELAFAHAVAASVAASGGRTDAHRRHLAEAERMTAGLPEAGDRDILNATLRVIPKPPVPQAAANRPAGTHADKHEPGPAMLPIVPIQASHAASFRACLDVVARERRYLAQVEAPALDRVQAFVDSGIAGDAVQFVALDAGRVVGWADIFPDWAHAVSHRGHLGMGVHPDYRGRGLGTRLLQACIAKAWAKGLTRVELESRADNLAAIHLYRKLGFTQETVKARGLRFDGTYYDAVQMALLSPAG